MVERQEALDRADNAASRPAGQPPPAGATAPHCGAARSAVGLAQARQLLSGDGHRAPYCSLKR